MHRTHLILQPLHALRAQLLLEQLSAQLAGQQGDVLDDGQAHPPVLVLSQLLDGRQQALGQQLNANHLQGTKRRSWTSWMPHQEPQPAAVSQRPAWQRDRAVAAADQYESPAMHDLCQIIAGAQQHAGLQLRTEDLQDMGLIHCSSSAGPSMPGNRLWMLMTYRPGLDPSQVPLWDARVTTAVPDHDCQQAQDQHLNANNLHEDVWGSRGWSSDGT